MTTTKKFPKITFADGTTCSSGPNCKKHGGKVVLFNENAAKAVSRAKAGIGKTTNAATENPHLLELWHPTLNNEDKLSDYLSNNHSLKAWWQCPVANDHVYQSPIVRKAKRGDGCPFCTGHKVCLSNSIATAEDRISQEYDAGKNKKPASEVYKNSRTKVWWKCVKSDHSWEATVVSRVKGGNNCPYCSGQKVAPENSIAGKFPELALLLNEEKTGKSAWEIGSGSPIKVWWNCSTGKEDHIYDSRVRDKTKRILEGKTTGCPYCSNYRVNNSNNMAFTNPKLAKEFNSEKNGITPDKIVAGSAKMMWWKCEKDHEWKATPATRLYAKTQCPKCVEWNSSDAEDRFRAVALKNDLFAYVSADRNNKLPIHWGKIGSMSVDIIGVLKTSGKECVIEYDGAYFHNSDDIIDRDLRKTNALLKEGYVVVRIRENKLPFVNIEHDNLFQLNHKASTKIEQVEETFLKINEWLKTI